MKKLTLFVAIILLSIKYSKAQDMIILNSKTEIKSKVIELTEEAIKYKKWEMKDGPTYSVLKNKVFMIIYANGQKETFENEEKVDDTKINAKGKVDVENSDDGEGNTNKKIYKKENSTNEYSFMPRMKDENLSRRDIRHDQINKLGVNLNSIGKSTFPYFSFGSDIFIAKNIAFTDLLTLGYNNDKIDVQGYTTSVSILIYNIDLGCNYYLNDVLKLKKKKGFAYVGIAMDISMPWITTTSNVTGVDQTKTTYPINFGVLGKIGGGYNFKENKRSAKGIWVELNIAQGGVGIIAGLAFHMKKGCGRKNK